jgi:DNA-binding NarL/FixJ family response regulator
MIRILLADDHLIIRGVLHQLLERTGEMEVVAVASNGEEAVAQSVLHSPDVAVIDVSMPNMDGIKAAEQIRASCPQTRVLMVSAYDTPNYIQRSLRAGALGYVPKGEAVKDLVTAIRSLYEGNRFFSKPIAQVAESYLQ